MYEEVKFILLHGFGVSWSLGHIALSLWWHSTSWWELMVEELCSPQGSHKAKRNPRRGQSLNIPCKGRLPNDITSSPSASSFKDSTNYQ